MHSRQQKAYQGTLETLYWTLQGPSKGPCDFRGFVSQFLPFLQNTFSKSPLKIVEDFMVIVVDYQGSGDPPGPSWTPKWTLILGDPW